ncbi:helix-turn-helix domain-containing protein [Amycolatopsis pithecellobii]|uniref:Uncharacterized protein n=1 Tax=Amycolatopsis pithecellobii TaxID=664692 RepID=A0A6N7YSN7_9PSEU|nr:helix-turn-helix domain-containing protein [Amycolatopsis pithecellobii]MTD54962.1 hypothetical protein [Amycolatopsis pithecellobii]
MNITRGGHIAMSWSAVRELCESLERGLPRIAERSTRKIRQELDEYGAVRFGEHVAAVHDQLHRLLGGIARRRALDESDLAQAVVLAQRRAGQGISVDVLINAFHIGHGELWNELRHAPGAAGEQLPEVATLVLESVHGISSVLAAAHTDVTAAQQSQRITLSQRLIELLASGESGPEAQRLAVALEFDPAAAFIAASWAGGPEDMPDSRTVSRSLSARGVVVATGHHSDSEVLITQGSTPVAIAKALGGANVVGAGIGLPREGVAGAVLSVGDAELARAASAPGSPASSLSETWYEACLLSNAQRLEPVLSANIHRASENPRLAQTVLTFAEGNMSIADTARLLNLHANTVTYRLDRWKKVTGWDPRTFDGLGKSVLACKIADR